MIQLHTPIPWRWGQSCNKRWYIYGTGDSQPIVVPNATGTTGHKTAKWEDNARFIVTAVNAYQRDQRVIAGLKDALTQILHADTLNDAVILAQVGLALAGEKVQP